MVAYTDIGTGIPLVLIHGLGSRKEAWEPQHALAYKYRLIIPDLRGHGETTSEDDITVPNFAKDILELMDSLEIESAVICGLSLGGIVAQELYKQAPKRVQKLILANTTAYINPFIVQTFSQVIEKHHKHESFIGEIVNRALYNLDYRWKASEAFYIRDSYMESFKAPVGLNYFPVLMSISVPVLLIGSAQDMVTPIINMLTMAPCIRRAKKVIFDKCGHLSNIEKSMQFNRVVDEFIGG